MRGIIAVIIFTLFSTGTVVIAGEVGRLYAQAQGYSPEVRQWFREQRVPGMSVTCCSEADGEEVSEDIRGEDYWIRNEKFPQWTLVPRAAVITEQTNILGRPVIWWGRDEEGGYTIRCFAPGAKF